MVRAGYDKPFAAIVKGGDGAVRRAVHAQLCCCDSPESCTDENFSAFLDPDCWDSDGNWVLKLEDGFVSVIKLTELPEQLAEVRLHGTMADVPEVSMQQLINAGLNAFGLQLFVESIANKKDASEFNPITFKFRGIKITMQPDGPIHTRHH